MNLTWQHTKYSFLKLIKCCLITYFRRITLEVVVTYEVYYSRMLIEGCRKSTK
jgi:hypothetical protein